MNHKSDLRIGIKFETDDSQFDVSKQKFKELMASLKEMQAAAHQTGLGEGLKKELSEAAVEAKKLENILKDSWNNNLDKMDFSKFNQGVKNAYGSFAGLKKELVSVGPSGASAFNQLTNSILSSNFQLKQTNTLLDKMSLTMANTIRFGISSSIFNNLTGSVSKAYNYVKKLDKSLNDIRIVSDASASDMERFAKHANNAAKSLGSSTLDYTQGALIYFQQGLDEQQVKERTDITLKMSNVLGTSAQEVSDYMTAIWNNFNDGSKSLEYYADVLTKLGAETASSAEEISQGLEKFAAVSDTVGLSYEYAAAALTTVTDRTRQSADVVGTAFKTLFARIQDLELGKTLDDGTTLGKYSEALAAVGVNIKDQNGQLKSMDAILDEMGSKWGSLADDQKVALAQNVAGVRQYTQLMSLMENWDFFQKNVDSARNATGSLQKQQEIYLESTEAHLQKVATEAERTYDILFDTKAINKFSDALSGALKILNTFLGSFGSGMNAIAFLGASTTSFLSKQIGSGLGKAVVNQENKKENEAKFSAYAELANAGMAENADNKDSQTYKAYAEDLENVEKLVGASKMLSAEEANRLNLQRQNIQQEKLRIAEIVDFGTKSTASAKVRQSYLEDQKKTTKEEIENYKKIQNLIKNIEKLDANDIKQGDIRVQKENELKEIVQDILEMKSNIDGAEIFSDEEKTQLQGMLTQYSSGEGELDSNAILEAQNRVISANLDLERQQTKELQLQLDYENDIKLKQDEQNLNRAQEAYDQETLQQIRSNAMANVTKGLSTAVQIGTVLTGIFQTLSDEETSMGEKFQKITVLLIGSLPMIISGFSSLVTLMPNLAVSMGLATSAADIGFKQATVSVLTFQTALGPLGWVLLAITAAVAGLVALGMIFAKNLNADAKAAEDAAKESQNLTENYEKLKNAAQELKDTISDYQAGLDELKKLDESTKEYGETLDKVNEKAKQLIETYGLYDQYDIVDGVIKFHDGVLDKIQAEADQQAEAARQEMYTSKINSNVMSLSNKATQISRGTGTNWGKLTLHTAGVGLGGVGANLAFNPDAYNKYSKETVTDVANGLNDLKEALGDDQFEILMSQNDETLRKSLLENSKVPDVIKENIDAYLENREALDDFAESIREVTEQNEYYANQILEGMVKEQYGERITKMSTSEDDTVNEKRAAQITSIVANQNEAIKKDMAKEFEENAKEAKEVSYNRDLKNYGYTSTMNDEELAREYARVVLGRKDADDLVYVGGNDKGGLKTATGETVLADEHTDDQKRQALARHYLDEQTKVKYGANLDADKTLDNIESIIGKGSKAGAKYGADFSDALLNAATSKDHKIDLTDMFVDIDPNEMQDILGMSDEQLLETFNLTSEELDTLGFKSAKEFAEAFRNGFTDYEWDLNKAIESSVGERQSELDKHSMDTKELSEYAKHLSVVSKDAKELSNNLKYDADASVVVAQSVMRMNRGVESLSDNFKDWNDIMKKSTKSSKEYSDAINKMRSSVADVLDVEEDAVSNDFLEKHLDDIKKAATGNEKAIDALRDAYADDLLLNIGVNNELDNATQKDLQGRLDKLQNQFSDIKIGTKLDSGKFLEEAQNIVDIAGMTEEQANAFFDSIGFDAEFETEEKKVTSQKPITETVTQDMSTENDAGDHITRTRTYSYNAGYTPVEETISVVAMGTNGKAPKIKSLTKKATGSMNNASTVNKGGGNKKSGGGGKSKKAEEQKIDFKPDRYHVVNTQISKTDNLLKQLQVSESHALGPELLDNYAKQWEELNNQVANYNDKLNIATDEYNELYNTLVKDGVKFNEDGTIANYMDILIQKRDEYNKLVTQYNKMAEKDQENFKKKVLDPAKEAFDQFKENLDRIDELISSTMKELESNIRDTVDQKIELAVKEFDVKIKYSADIKDLTITVNDFIEKTVKGLKDDDIFGNFLLNQKNLGALLSSDGQSGYLVDLADQLKNTGMQFEKMANEATIFGDNVEKGLDYYGEKLDDFIQGYTDLIERQKAIKQAFTDLYDSVNEKVQTQIEYYDKVSSILDHHKKVIELIYGEKAYGKLKKLSDLQIQNGKKELLTLQQARDVNQDLIESKNTQIIAAKENLETIKTQYGVESEIYKQKIKELQDLEEERKKLIAQDIEYANQIEDKFDEVADAINNSLTEAIGDIINQLNNALSPNGLDYAQEQWELITRDAEIYLDTINRLQGENSLESKYLDSINKATDPSVQKKLKAAMDAELKALREKDNLTQYDLDRAEKKYQITLAQIALEEAQQNKSEMRLRRDSQGNYRYQYVADENAVNKAKQDLNNAYVDLYNFDKERYLEVNNTILDLTKETQDKIKEIWADTSKSYEEREAEAALWTEKLNSQIAKYQTERIATEANLNESAFDSLKVLYENDEQAFEEAVSDKDKTLKQLIPQLASEGAEIAKNTNLVKLNEEAAKAAQTAALEATGLIKENLQDIKEDLQDIEEGANAAIDSLESLVKDNEDSIAEDLANLKIIDATIAQNQEIIDSFTNEKNIIDLVEKSYRNLIEAKKDLIENYDEKNEGGQKPTHVVDPTEYQKLVDDAKQKIIDNINKGSGEGSGEEPKVETESYPYGKASETSGTIKSGSKGDAVRAIQYALNKLGYGNSGTQSVDGNFGPGTESAVRKFQKAMGLTVDGKVGKNTRKKFKAQGFASGGYTGTWGNGARLAFLHQKELVLNAQDTENILNTVAIMRNLMTSLNDNILSRLANVSAGTVRGLDSGNNELEQNVHIEANFPSVTSANEIEAAIKNLVNVASQRIHE